MNLDEIKLALTRATAIPNYRGYFITRDGTVISTRRKNPIVMSQARNRSYLMVGLVDDAQGRQVMHYVHELILTTYVGPRPTPDHQCRHLNGKHHDNRLDNLAWGTPKENGQDRVRHGTQRNAYGESNAVAKLTEADVLVIVARADAGEKQDDIAADYGISQSLVSYLKPGKKWTHITRRAA